MVWKKRNLYDSYKGFAGKISGINKIMINIIPFILQEVYIWTIFKI